MTTLIEIKNLGIDSKSIQIIRSGDDTNAEDTLLHILAPGEARNIGIWGNVHLDIKEVIL